MFPSRLSSACADTGLTGLQRAALTLLRTGARGVLLLPAGLRNILCTGTGQFPADAASRPLLPSASVVTAAVLSAVLGLVPLSWKAASIPVPTPPRLLPVLSAASSVPRAHRHSAPLTRLLAAPAARGWGQRRRPSCPRASPPRTSLACGFPARARPGSATRSCLSGRASAVLATHSVRLPRRLSQRLGRLPVHFPGPLPLLCLRLSSGHHASLEKMGRPRPWSRSTCGP